MAEAAKLKPLELYLKRIEDLSQDIIVEFNDMKRRAAEMRNTNSTFFTDVHYNNIYH